MPNATRYTMGVDYGYGSDLSCYTLFDCKKGKMEWQWSGIGEPRFPWWLRLRMFFRQVTVMYESPRLSKRMTMVIESTPQGYNYFKDEFAVKIENEWKKPERFKL